MFFFPGRETIELKSKTISSQICQKRVNAMANILGEKGLTFFGGYAEAKWIRWIKRLQNFTCK